MSKYPPRTYAHRTALLNGDSVTVDGRTVVADASPLVAGDLYVGERNSVQLARCTYVNDEQGWIEGRSLLDNRIIYPFDTGECVKVRLV